MDNPFAEDEALLISTVKQLTKELQSPILFSSFEEYSALATKIQEAAAVIQALDDKNGER